MIQGLVPTLVVGLGGSVLAELLRLAGPFVEGKGPNNWREWVGSIIYALTGAAAPLYIPWDTPHTPLEVTLVGAAIPAVFPAAAHAVGSLKDNRKSQAMSEGTVPKRWKIQNAAPPGVLDTSELEEVRKELEAKGIDVVVKGSAGTGKSVLKQRVRRTLRRGISDSAQPLELGACSSNQ